MDIDRDPESEQYFERHYGLAVSLARRFAMRASWSDSGDDLTQVALMGLVRAIGRFDPQRGVPFSAFATTTIVGELKHYMRDRSWTVRPPRRVQNLYLRSQEVIGELTQEIGRSPTMSEIGDRVDATPEQVIEALEAATFRRPASLDAPLAGGDGDDRTLAARLASSDQGMAEVDERLALARLLARLPERERRMVRLRFIEGLTQTEIATRMSLSQAHVQRLLARSLVQLRVLAAAS